MKLPTRFQLIGQISLPDYVKWVDFFSKQEEVEKRLEPFTSKVYARYSMQRHQSTKNTLIVTEGFGGVVVITSALHAEGLGFEPRSNLPLFFSNWIFFPTIFGLFSCFLLLSDFWTIKNCLGHSHFLMFSICMWMDLRISDVASNRLNV